MGKEPLVNMNEKWLVWKLLMRSKYLYFGSFVNEDIRIRETGDRRQNTGDRRQETEYGRQEAGDGIRETGDRI